MSRSSFRPHNRRGVSISREAHHKAGTPAAGHRAPPLCSRRSAAGYLCAGRRALQQAVELYRGDLLLDCYDAWISDIREALRNRLLAALERLTMAHEILRDYPAAIRSAQLLLRHDPLNEGACRDLIRLYALCGDRGAALRVYQQCVAALRRELGVEPDAETKAAYERLKQQSTAAASAPPPLTPLPLVGRMAEWRVPQQTWRDSVRGRAHVVLIIGEAGIGKTRLAEELQAMPRMICAGRRAALIPRRVETRRRIWSLSGASLTQYMPVREVTRRKNISAPECHCGTRMLTLA